MEGRDPVRAGTVSEWQKDKQFIHTHEHVKPDIDDEGRRVPLTLFESPVPYDGYKWGMAVDLSACTGCGACVVACQSENNSPVVGKDEVLRGREMHWLRIDYYRSTPKDDPHNYSMARHHFQPLMCQHCEKAPCEVVCPVAATAHGDEGTNDMVYNRCVGTKYCANNCPYKVRRFNFLEYADFTTPSVRLMYNPDVTVRSRGVMEKCTFCIQRIAYARIEAEKEAIDEQALPPDQRRRDDPNRRTTQGKAVAYIPDGEVMTACQSACPAEAIIFGDLNDRKSRVRRLHRSERADGSHLHLRYDLLGELGTRPRVAYLAELRNPNPALEAK
jgi:molybdopterin-containing oxidoreductase family iron-sulfur binding subunit